MSDISLQFDSLEAHKILDQDRLTNFIALKLNYYYVNSAILELLVANSCKNRSNLGTSDSQTYYSFRN